MMAVTLLQFWGRGDGCTRHEARVAHGAAAVVVGLGLFVLGVLMLAPLVWMIAESLTDERTRCDLPPNWIPKPFTLDNYRDIVRT